MTIQQLVDNLTDLCHHGLAQAEVKLMGENLVHNVTGVERVDDNTVLIVEPNGFKTYRDSDLPNIISFYLESDEAHRTLWMRKRGDPEDKISSRIINDRISFRPENIEGVTYSLNSNDLSIEKLALMVNDIYKNRIRLVK